MIRAVLYDIAVAAHYLTVTCRKQWLACVASDELKDAVVGYQLGLQAPRLFVSATRTRPRFV